MARRQPGECVQALWLWNAVRSGPRPGHADTAGPRPSRRPKRLRELWLRQQDIGVSHVGLHFKPQRRPASEVIDELGTHLLPLFPSHEPEVNKATAAGGRA